MQFLALVVLWVGALTVAPPAEAQCDPNTDDRNVALSGQPSYQSTVDACVVEVMAATTGPSPSAISTPPRRTIQYSRRDTATDHINRGLTYYNKKDYKLAISEYNQAISADPTFGLGYFQRAEVDIMSGRPSALEDAIQDLDRSLEREMPEYYRCAAFHVRGNFRAIEVMASQAAARTGETLPEGFTSLMKWDLPIDDQTQVIERCLSNNERDIRIGAFIKRGRFYNMNKQYELAIQDFNHAIALDSKSAEALYKRGQVEQVLGRTAEAERDIQAAKRIDPQVDQK